MFSCKVQLFIKYFSLLPDTFSYLLTCLGFLEADLSLPDVQPSPSHSATPSPSPEAPGPSTSSASRHHRAHRSGGARDERYRSGSHCSLKNSTKHRPAKVNPTKAQVYYIIFVSLFAILPFRHPHRSCAGSPCQTQRREDGTAHADQETLTLCPVSSR